MNFNPAVGGEIRKTRPAVIISNDARNDLLFGGTFLTFLKATRAGSDRAHLAEIFKRKRFKNLYDFNV